MGILDHVSDYFDCSGGGSPKKRRAFQTVEVYVLIDCEGCERKVRRALEGMKGVEEIEIEREAQKVRVIGYVEPEKVVARIANRTGKRAELWPFLPYDTVARPYADGVYDRRAPSGYVRDAHGHGHGHGHAGYGHGHGHAGYGHAGHPQPSRYLARASSTEVRYSTAFSDENPGACSIM